MVLYLSLALLFLQTGCAFSAERGRAFLMGSGEYADWNNLLPSDPKTADIPKDAVVTISLDDGKFLVTADHVLAHESKMVEDCFKKKSRGLHYSEITEQTMQNLCKLLKQEAYLYSFDKQQEKDIIFAAHALQLKTLDHVKNVWDILVANQARSVLWGANDYLMGNEGEASGRRRLSSFEAELLVKKAKKYLYAATFDTIYSKSKNENHYSGKPIMAYSPRGDAIALGKMIVAGESVHIFYPDVSEKASFCPEKLKDPYYINTMHGVESLTYNHNGTSLAVGSNVVQVWDIETNQHDVLHNYGDVVSYEDLHKGQLKYCCLAYTADGKYLAHARGNTLLVRDTRTSEPCFKNRVDCHDNLTALCWGSDNTLITASGEGMISIFDPRTFYTKVKCWQASKNTIKHMQCHSGKKYILTEDFLYDYGNNTTKLSSKRKAAFLGFTSDDYLVKIGWFKDSSDPRVQIVNEQDEKVVSWPSERVDALAINPTKKIDELEMVIVKDINDGYTIDLWRVHKISQERMVDTIKQIAIKNE